jgi:hypothetical protein
MKLKNLHIRAKESWEDNPHSFMGSVCFESPNGEVKINIDEVTAAKILLLCSEGVIRAAQATSMLMIQEISPVGALLHDDTKETNR